MYERTGNKEGGKVDWTSVSPQEAQALAERMFDAANVPLSARNDYYREFNLYLWISRKELEMDILNMLDKIRNTQGCIVYSPCGLPSLSEGVDLPNDLKVFYENCGGVSFFTDSAYGFRIVSPEEMVLANPIIVGELCEEDISSGWYIIGKDIENNYITIDLAKERLGRCYDSFWDRHGVAGECAIVAQTFTELISQLYSNQGKSLFWLDDDFNSLGDAYDEV